MIMYNKLYKYLAENNLLYCKQLVFQEKYSPEQVILQVVEQINQSFEKNEFIHGTFVN